MSDGLTYLAFAAMFFALAFSIYMWSEWRLKCIGTAVLLALFDSDRDVTEDDLSRQLRRMSIKAPESELRKAIDLLVQMNAVSVTMRGGTKFYRFRRSQGHVA